MVVDTILKEISEFNFDKTNIFSFLSQETKKFSSFYYFKHMLFSILDHEKHLDLLLAYYYNLEYGELLEEEVAVRLNTGYVKKIKREDLLKQKQEKVKEVMTQYLENNPKALQKVLAYGKNLASLKETFKTVEKKIELLLKEYEELQKSIGFQEDKILECRKVVNDYKRVLETKAPLVIVETKKGERKEYTYKHFRKLAFRKISRKMDKKIYSFNLEKEKKKEDSFLVMEKMHAIFLEYDASFLWDILVKKHDYYDQKISFRNIKNELFQVCSCYPFLEEDLYRSSKMIQSYLSLTGYIKNGNVLSFVCKKIRESMEKAGFGASLEKWENGVRKIDLVSSKTALYKLPDYTELKGRMEKLSSVYFNLLREKNSVSFVRNCAIFSFDFLINQFYLEENTRTAQILLTLVLLTHQIFIPSSYVVPVSKEKTYINKPLLFRSYGEIESELLERYAFFYPASFSKGK